MARHKLGVGLFLAAALLSFLLSIGLWFADERQEGLGDALVDEVAGAGHRQRDARQWLRLAPQSEPSGP